MATLRAFSHNELVTSVDHPWTLDSKPHLVLHKDVFRRKLSVFIHVTEVSNVFVFHIVKRLHTISTARGSIMAGMACREVTLPSDLVCMVNNIENSRDTCSIFIMLTASITSAKACKDG